MYYLERMLPGLLDYAIDGPTIHTFVDFTALSIDLLAKLYSPSIVDIWPPKFLEKGTPFVLRKEDSTTVL